MEPNSSDRLQETGLRFKGRITSRGSASGTVFVLPSPARPKESRNLDDAGVDVELEKFDSALSSVVAHLRNAAETTAISDDAKKILEAQKAMLEDGGFINKVRHRIQTDREGASLSIRVVTDEYVDQLRLIDDEHLREKAADIQDISEQLLTTLTETVPSYVVPEGAVIVVGELWPSTVLSLVSSRPAAFITESGGWTSHSFILARELGIPAVSGVKNVDKRLSTGDAVVVDAENGLVTVSGVRDTFSGPGSNVVTINESDREGSSSIVTLNDGTELFFLANADSPEKFLQAFDLGVGEIALVRSEYLFELNGALPDEATQSKVYSEITSVAKGRPVTIRTFDVSVSRLASRGNRFERNPALGMRSIRLTLKYERQFRAQLRSLIRANSANNLSIVIPMVSGAADIIRIRALLATEFEKVHLQDDYANLPSLGAMIELPSAVLTIDDILDTADFICVGTNDLVQYTLGVDRDNESVADWYQTLHPSITRSLDAVIKAAESANKCLTICGEMAGSPFYLPLLVGLGVRRLSMNPSSIPSMIGFAGSLSIDECRTLAERTLNATSAVQNEKLVAEFCRDQWPQFEIGRVNFPPTNMSEF